MKEPTDNEIDEIARIASSDLPRPKEYTERRPERAWLRRLAQIPKRMLTTRIQKLPPGTQAAMKALGAKDWEHLFSEGLGFNLAGPTGTGKTRMATMIALRMAAETWARPHFLSAVAIRSTAFSDYDAADRMIRAATKAGILVLDDLGKGTPTGTVDDVLFAIIDERINAMRPTILTTNYGPEELIGRFKEPETARAALRRIFEFNEPIILDDQGQ